VRWSTLCPVPGATLCGSEVRTLSGLRGKKQVRHPTRSEHRCPPGITLVLLYWAMAYITVSIVLFIALTH
jgi:hypothetical protein